MDLLSHLELEAQQYALPKHTSTRFRGLTYAQFNCSAHRQPSPVILEQRGLSPVTFQRADINVPANSQLEVLQQARPSEKPATCEEFIA